MYGERVEDVGLDVELAGALALERVVAVDAGKVLDVVLLPVHHVLVVARVQVVAALRRQDLVGLGLVVDLGGRSARGATRACALGGLVLALLGHVHVFVGVVLLLVLGWNEEEPSSSM